VGWASENHVYYCAIEIAAFRLYGRGGVCRSGRWLCAWALCVLFVWPALGTFTFSTSPIETAIYARKWTR
jgi:hypothetical protein